MVNVSSNQDGTKLTNSAVIEWNSLDEKGNSVTKNVGPVSAANVTVISPELQVTKTAVDTTNGNSAPPITGDAGDTITYTIVVEHAPSSDTDAFDLALTDVVPAGMTYITNSASLVSGDAFTSLSFDGGTQTLTIGWVSFPLGHSATISFQATINSSVSPGQALTNTANLQWTSLSGDYHSASRSPYSTLAVERTGDTTNAGGAANTYSASGSAVVNVVTSLTKAVVTTSELLTTVGSDGEERLAIGEIARYRLRMTLPEGTASNFRVTDVLPAGMEYLNDGTTEVAFVSNQDCLTPTPSISSNSLGTAPWQCGNEANIGTIVPSSVLPDTSISGAPFGSGTAPTFSLGTLQNMDRDLDTEYVVIEFNALVLNESGNTTEHPLDNSFKEFVGTPSTLVATSNTVSAIVAQPNLTISKTLATAPQDAGDTAVYDLTITNTDTGANGATAFDLSLSDTLDSRLTPVSIAFDATNSTQAAICVGGTVFAHSESFSAQILSATASCLDPGNKLVYDVTATVVSNVPVATTIPNTAYLQYTSLPGPYGTSTNSTGSSTPGASGSANGERIYNASASRNAPLSGPSLSKLLPSPDDPAGVDAPLSKYAIGATVDYYILVILPEGLTPSLTVVDHLPDGLGYVNSQVITSTADPLNPPGSDSRHLASNFNGTFTSPGTCQNASSAPCSLGDMNQDLSFVFGDTQTNGSGPANGTSNNSFLLLVRSQVQNIPGNNDGTGLTNQASLAYLKNGVLTNVSGGAQTITIVEAKIDTTKSVDKTSGVQAGDVLKYSITFTNSGDATAYDTIATDTLAVGVAYTGPTTCVYSPDGKAGSEAPIAVTASYDNATNVLSLDGNPAGSWDIAVSGYIRCTYPATAQSSLTLVGSHTNTVNTLWTSLNGVIAGERTYAGSASATFTSGSPFSISKDNGGITQAAIGQRVDITLTIASPLGTLKNAVVTDTLPVGLIYVDNSQTVSSDITPDSDATGFLASSPNDGSSTVTLTWNFGTDAVVHQSPFTITYQAMPANVAGNVDGTNLTNNVTLSYNNAAGVAQTPLTSSSSLTVVESVLQLTKSIVPYSVKPEANEAVTYQVVIDSPPASSHAVAYNVHFTDALPASVTFVGGSVKVTSTTGTIGAVDSSGSSGNTVDVVVASIPIGASITLQYQATLNISVTPGQLIANTADVTWESTSDTTNSGAYNGNRNGSSGAGGLNDYFATSSASFTTNTITAEKSIVGSSQSFTSIAGNNLSANAAIGELLRYRLSVLIPQGTLPAFTLKDTMPIGFTYEGNAKISFVTDKPITANSTLVGADNSAVPPTFALPNGDVTISGQDIAISLGDLVNNNSDLNQERVVVDFDVLVNNDTNNNAFDSSKLTKINNFSTQIGGNAAGTSNDVTATIVESKLTITKSANDLNPGPNEVVKYTVTVKNNSAAPASSTTDAFDVNMTDDLPTGLALDLSSIQTVPTGWTPKVANNSAGNKVDLLFDTFPLGDSIAIAYKATVSSSVPNGTSIGNTANLTWTSLPGTDTNERTGTIGSTTAPNNYFASSNASLSVLRALSKTVAPGSIQLDTDPADVTASRPPVSPPTLPTVYIGETLVYQIVLTLPPGDTDGMTLTDTLDRGLAFVKCETITPQSTDLTTDASGASSTDFSPICSNPTVSTEPSGSTNLADAGRKMLYNFGNVHNANAASQTITLVYDVIVLDNQENVNGVNGLKNNAAWTWDTGTLSAAAQGVNVREANLSIVKTVNPQIASIGSTVSFNLHIEHASQSAADAYDALVTDAIPAGLVIDPASVVATAPGLPPALVTVNISVLTVYWSHFPLGSQADVSFTAQFVGPSPQTNTSTVEWSSIQIDPRPHFVALSAFNTLSTERRYVPASATINDYFASSTVALQAPRGLPKTGFAPRVRTILPVQPLDKAYNSIDGMWLEIPALNLKMPIIGVPASSDGWDLTWLTNEAGYLEGTTFPTHVGTTGITGHVYLADGTPGPFRHVGDLVWGDQIILHAYGQRYIYEVRENRVVLPTDMSVFNNDGYTWLALLTCKSYLPSSNTYEYRIVVRAVLVNVEDDPEVRSPTYPGGR